MESRAVERQRALPKFTLFDTFDLIKSAIKRDKKLQQTREITVHR